MIALNSVSSVSDMNQLMQLYQVDLEAASRQKDIYFIEHFLRQVPAAFEDAVCRVK